jgi:hypothetical protein
VRTTDVIMMDARVFMRSPNSMLGTKSPVQRQRRKTTLRAKNPRKFLSVLRLLTPALCPLVSAFPFQLSPQRSALLPDRNSPSHHPGKRGIP